MDLQKMGKFIAEMRKKRGLTQSELGEELGLSGKAISKWERGLNAPDISILNELGEILDVNVSEILSGEKIEENITTETANEITVSSIDTYNKFFKKKYSRIILGLITLILLIILLLLGTYFITNYNKCFVYKLSSGRDDFTLEGLIASNQSENSIIITGIVFADQNVGTMDEIIASNIEVSLYIESMLIDRKIYNYNNKKLTEIAKNLKIVVNESEKLKKSKDVINDKHLNDVKIVIKYIDNSDQANELEIPVKIEKKFSNNRLFY